MEQTVLTASGLTMRYHSTLALDNLDLTLPQGKIVGLLGPNGSGKTTFIKQWCRLYDPTEGQILLNGILTNLGRPLLSLDARYGFWGLIILMCWQQIGYMMIIYIAGLQNVPGDLLEAAAIDGATGAQALFRVKLPMVMPSITICTFLTLTNSFKLFDQNLSLTGGEPAKASQMLALNIYDTFYQRSGAQWKGIGQAKAVVFFLLVIVIALIQLYFTRRKEVQQ